MAHADILARMANDLGMLPGQLANIIKTAPLRYKVFTIPKRDGTRRTIAQPAREVKAIQRWLINELRPQLPIHDAVMAYEPGTSIKKNAEMHLRSQFILKMDFSNFFPSISAEALRLHLELHCGNRYSLADRHSIVRACTWAPERAPTLQLCIGAPSSPLLSNSVMYEFDCAIAQKAKSEGVTYTRYADDITFSATERGILAPYFIFVKEMLQQLAYPKITINERKTVHASRAGRRVVTGLILTPDGKISVGRDRKRLARSMFHRRALGLLSADESIELDGLLAFIDSVEPGFSDRLRAAARNSRPHP
ncbi:RNA-directed DNA polymerase [Burkholderia cenocepacia]|uniref:retron St85 family RNA-directed DNA polymerase n=1 Tax=Burkholderia cenocepacia TaxID=95486 RepID=UPI000F55ECE0|nr:retron St85 family RNA-directed DNA polymerase [Burkholderia cenocepacia]RQU41566.1 RNA-directed DNA polymerase [Burkholderia cenocepacia]RQU71551.1 RNA-directed DNA polymerase [Burkholderia cenocepacia]